MHKTTHLTPGGKKEKGKRDRNSKQLGNGNRKLERWKNEKHYIKFIVL